MKYKIIENTKEARDEFGWNYGGEDLKITLEELKEIENGKCLAIDINGGEYSEFISLKER